MDPELVVAVVALIISVIALVGSVLQLLQQYYASAEGYSNCGEQVMGEWSLLRRRKFRWSELRFETQFATPVIFLCPPHNERGPLGLKGPNQPLWHVQGTPESEAETRVPSVEREAQKKEQLSSSKKMNEDVHTADNERANWFILLQAFHAMERDSQRWQKGRLTLEKKTLGPKTSATLPEDVAGWESHSVVAALQPKRKSWDTMPADVKKPYATTTICHMVEMVAMLGLHWREFDRSNQRFHAEGNGYLLKGHEVGDLGLMFGFQIYGGNKFERNRVIPSDEIKKLAFGNVTTIYIPGPDEKGKIPYDMDDPKTTGVLQFGSENELVESLAHYGCNSKTTNYFRDAKKRHGHLFPVVFEVLGMVAASVHIPDTYYRFLPNPTTYSWNRKNFSLRKLILEFNKAVADGDITEQTGQVREIQKWGNELRAHLKPWSNEDHFSLALLRSLHAAVNNCDAYLQGQRDPIVTEKLVKLVVREHVQEVMKQLNETTSLSSKNNKDDSDDSTLSSDKQGGCGGSQSKTKSMSDELNSAAPEEKQKVLVDMYFTTVLQAVTRNCLEALQRKESTQYVHSPDTRSVINLPAEASEAVAEEYPRPPTPQLLVSPTRHLERLQHEQEMHAQITSDVWCTLMFRAFCWLLLHDFHKKDVQISKSELYGSRLPVYIA